MPGSDRNADSVVASPATRTSLLIAVQVISKLFTFVSNQLILRKLHPETLGIAAQLELYSISILYFSREAVRLAIQRQPLGYARAVSEKGSGHPQTQNTREITEARLEASQSVINMSYLSLGLGIPLAVVSTTFYIQLAPDGVSQAQFYHLSILLTACALVIELCSEPFFAIIQQHMLYKKRALVEMTAALAKSLAVCGSVVWAARASRNIGVLPFALGYACYATTLTCGYAISLLSSAGQRSFSLLPKLISSRNNSSYILGRFPRHLVSLFAAIFLQSVIKHLLTQGDSMMLAAMASLQDQGIYSLASNYGGLIARIVFQPIEESSRAVFSSLLNGGKGNDRWPDTVGTARAHLTNILRIYVLFCALVVPLGPCMVPRVLHALGGRRWASAEVDSLLSLYCYYIPFLAFNGITEAFVSSAASTSDLRRQSRWMGVFSGCFAVAAYSFLIIGDMGARGLVWANIFNMGVRITWSLLFIRSYLCRNNHTNLAVTEISPRPLTLISAVIASMILTEQEQASYGFHGIIKDLITCTGYTLLVAFLERRFLLAQIGEGRRTTKKTKLGGKTE
ncbi:Rft-1-domain-containing protein [Aspergillus steynii IBT 23096]|uniref:Man(5)GlcNAc(2)-PP-dolichol translocation protein RFT1 n=1 Tax=Aspergillus steynii IBT 23096 TaxID=1392250 RepID=A0A2I2GCA2_9EURO|nr:Rft-1-domain-containing protein [Aspergillus steynii IBT 23096]PLB50508.1 Rft-1-domain-containing protein [Aspergillus steynii IBT 23096]